MNQRNEETLAWGPVPVGLGEAHANSSRRWCLLPGWISMCSWSGYLLRNLVLSTHLKKSIFFMALIFCLCDLFFFSRSLFSIWLFVALIFKSRTKGDVTVMTYRMWSIFFSIVLFIVYLLHIYANFGIGLSISTFKKLQGVLGRDGMEGIHWIMDRLTESLNPCSRCRPLI